MSISGGPNIIDNGLVMYLDTTNPRSFRGEPTTNLQDPNINNWSNSGATITQDSQGSPIGTPAYIITDNSTGSYSFVSRNITVPNDSTTYTISAYIKKTIGATSSRLGFNSGFLGGTTTISLNQRFNSDTGVGNAGTTEDLGTWWRWNFQLSNNSTGNTTLRCNFYPATGFYNSSDNAAATGSATISGIQIESKSYATPFVSGFRGTTVATGGGWGDITGNNNNGELVNGSIFNSGSGGSIVFDGLDDYTTVAYNSILDTPNGATYCAWIYPTGTGEFLSRGTSDSGPTPDNPRFYIDITSKYIYFDWSSVSLDRYVSTTNNSFNSNTWIYVVGTVVAGGRMEVYVNGSICSYTTRIQADTMPNPLPNTSTAIQIGAATWIPRYFGGRIASVSLYNRALSAQEILQNFNATRSRFGI